LYYNQNVLNPAVLRARQRLAEAFQAATPFKHAVIDGFLKPEFCARLLAEFPAYDAERFRDASGSPGKATREDVAALSPAYRKLDATLRSPAFLAFVSEVVGIPGLIHDPDYVGGGTHENLHDMELAPHVDFNFQRQSSLHRRVNLLLYLNPVWKPAWGGMLELHTDPRLPRERNPVKTVAPLFNRCVVFNTHEKSWHGVSRVALPRAKRALSRKSFALYLYSKERPAEEIAPRRSTRWVHRRLPARLKPGRKLTRADVAELDRLLAMRDTELDELHRETRLRQIALELRAKRP